MGKRQAGEEPANAGSPEGRDSGERAEPVPPAPAQRRRWMRTYLVAVVLAMAWAYALPQLGVRFPELPPGPQQAVDEFRDRVDSAIDGVQAAANGLFFGGSAEPVDGSGAAAPAPAEGAQPRPRASPTVPQPPSPLEIAGTDPVELLPATDLIYRVPPELQPSCKPVDNGDRAVDTIDCADGLTRAFYSRYADMAEADLQFDLLVGGNDLPGIPGGCERGRPSLEDWRYTSSLNKPEGRLACYTLPDGAPVTILTQPARRLFVLVVSNPSVSLLEHHKAWTKMVPNTASD